METATKSNGVAIRDNGYEGFSREQIDLIKKSIAKDTNDTELKLFLNVCRSTGLNAFRKEIWCYKDTKGNLLMFAGRDGFLANAQKNEAFAGIRSCDVCENDDLVLDMMNPSQNKHIINHANRGKILGAYAIVFRHNGEPTISYVDFKSYDRGFNTWKTHPSAMIKKVAEIQALKLAFGMSGIQSEHEFEIVENTAIPIDHTLPNDDLQEIKEGLEKIKDESGLNKYFRQLDSDLQKNSEVINLFRIKKESF